MVCSAVAAHTLVECIKLSPAPAGTALRLVRPTQKSSIDVAGACFLRSEQFSVESLGIDLVC